MALADTAKDSIIEQVIQGIEAKLDPSMKADYQRIVVAGMHFMFDPGTHKYMIRAIERGAKGVHLSAALVQGIVQLIAIIAKESKGQMKVPAAFPAAITLLCHAAEFVEAHAGAKITKENLSTMIHALLVRLMKAFKIDQNKLAQGLDQARANQGNMAPSPEAASPEQPTEPPGAPAQAPGQPMPSYKEGVKVVPQTGAAIIHAGEQVVPAKDNPNLTPAERMEEYQGEEVVGQSLRNLREKGTAEVETQYPGGRQVSQPLIEESVRERAIKRLRERRGK